MTLSDQLTKLAARAKETENRATAAKTMARAQLEQDVKAARDEAQADAEELRKTVEAGTQQYSAWWDDLQQSWNDMVAEIRRNIDEKRAEHDVDAAQRAADRAEKDAEYAIAFATGAIEEAEYAVLDATLARMNADSVAAKSGS